MIADDFKVPVVGTGTVDQLAVPPAKYFFRTPPGASTFLGALMDWAKQQGYKTIAILNPTDAVGQDESGILHKLAPAAGFKIVAAERYNTSDTDFTAQLVNIRNAKPDFFYAGTIGAPAILVFKQIKQLQLKMPLAIHAAAFGRTFLPASVALPRPKASMPRSSGRRSPARRRASMRRSSKSSPPSRATARPSSTRSAGTWACWSSTR